MVAAAWLTIVSNDGGGLTRRSGESQLHVSKAVLAHGKLNRLSIRIAFQDVQVGRSGSGGA
jgi:hypothetical protein